ncbi:MAG: D-aminoacyl-tRNA deacylase [Actinomycetota bacterium]
MRVVLQRVSRASVDVAGERVAQIGRGYLLLVGVGAGDPTGEEPRLAKKIATLRVLADGDGRMNLALAEVDGEVLVVSQFTLYGDIRKGRRPSWTRAEDPAIAARRVEAFAACLEGLGVRVARGIFGADMQVDLESDGPVTLVIDAADLP